MYGKMELKYKCEACGFGCMSPKLLEQHKVRCNLGLSEKEYMRQLKKQQEEEAKNESNVK